MLQVGQEVLRQGYSPPEQPQVRSGSIARPAVSLANFAICWIHVLLVHLCSWPGLLLCIVEQSQHDMHLRPTIVELSNVLHGLCACNSVHCNRM